MADQLGATHRGDAFISGVSFNSRDVRSGDLFLAFHGEHHDGHSFIDEALRRGAVALVVDHLVDYVAPQILVSSVNESAGVLASLFYGRPSEQLEVVGVTGTNGKTTTCQLLRACLSTPERFAAQIGTTGTFMGDDIIAHPSLSTPEAPELQRLFAQLSERGATRVAMEVTSHGLDRHRVSGTHFRVGVFLNLSPEHLDYHGSMEKYFEVKSRMFSPDHCESAVICVDDEWGRRLASNCTLPKVTFGRDESADVRVETERHGLDGLLVRLHGPDGVVELTSPLVGQVNASNIAGAFLAARRLGVSTRFIVEAIRDCVPPPGRFEVLTTDEPYLVIADYAHTPDALEALLATAREVATGQVHLILGARGERYAAKRPEMARIAATADFVQFTTDNPGDEDPASIIAAMWSGVPEDRRAHVGTEPDRKAAIRHEIARLGDGDILLMTGRGPESTQRFGSRHVVLDDRVVARIAIDARPIRADGLHGRPTVAVVIPAHNSAETLSVALRSVFAQTVPVDEIVVVDDGSTDQTVDVAHSFGAKVSILRQPNLGPSAARNAGVAHSSSRWIAFLDADDEWHPRKIEVQLSALTSRGAVLCASDWTASSDEVTASSSTSLLSRVTTTDLLILNRFQTSTVLVRRDVVGRAGGFSSELDGAEDWDMWLRVSALGEIVKIDSPLVFYRDHADGYSKDLRRHYDATIVLVRRELVDGTVARSREIRAWHFLRFAVSFALLGDREQSRKCVESLRDEHLVAIGVVASIRLLIPFLCKRTVRRLTRS